MAEVSSDQRGTEQETAQQGEASSNERSQAANSPVAPPSSAHSTSEAPRSFGSRLRKLGSDIFNRSKELNAVISISIVALSMFSGVYARFVTPGPRLEKIVPLAIGDTGMMACILRNDGVAFEKDIRVTLRAEPIEHYEMSFQGAEGFARLLKDDGQETLIVENEVISTNGGITRLEVDRLAPGQMITVTVKYPRSTTLSCGMTGSSGSIKVSDTRFLRDGDYLNMFLLYIFAAVIVITISEFVRNRRDKQRLQRQGTAASAINTGDS